MPRALSCALLLCTSLRAEPPFALQVHYSVPKECPDREWLSAHIGEQLGEQHPPNGTLDVEIEIESSERGFLGLAVFGDETGANAPWERQLKDVDCEALLRAIVLGMVLHWESTAAAESTARGPTTAQHAAADPIAAELVAAKASAEEHAAAEASAEEHAAAKLTAAEASAEFVTGGDPWEDPLELDTLEQPPVVGGDLRRERGFYPLAGAGVGMRTGLNPAIDFAAAAHVGVRGLANHFRAGRYQLVLQRSFGNDSQGATDGTSATPVWHGHWWALGVHLCPWGQRNGSFVIALCADGQLVRYHAAIPEEGTSEAAWATTVGPGVDAALQFKGFGLRLDAGLDVPLAPARTLYQRTLVFRQGPGVHAVISAEVFPWDPG